MTRYTGPIDPDRFQMKDIKRRVTSVEKKLNTFEETMKRRMKALRLENRALRQELLEQRTLAQFPQDQPEEGDE